MTSLSHAATSHLLPGYDTLKVEDPDHGFKHTHEVTFRHSKDPSDIVIVLTIFPGDYYKVSASSCVPTAKFLEFTAAYARARDFVIMARLRPRVLA